MKQEIRLDPNSPDKLTMLAKVFYDLAAKMGQMAETDPAETAMALSFAATKMLYDHAEGAEKQLGAAKVMADCSLKSMADMVSGSDAHQVSQ